MFYINETETETGAPIAKKQILTVEQEGHEMVFTYYKNGAAIARFVPTEFDLEFLAGVIKSVRKGRRK